MIHKTAIGRPATLTALCLAGSFLGGCIWGEERPKRLDLGVAPSLSSLADSAAYQGTVGQYTYYDGLRPMRVRGYGLVVGLGKNGSRDCPRPIYEKLVESMYKQGGYSSPVVGERNVTPEELIRDIDSAVVIVQGDIPAGAVRGTPFDVAVMALPGTQTKSLRRGRLLATDLRVFVSVSAQAARTGQILARASGPLFLNPFSEEKGAATRSTNLEATILGGGVVAKDRRLRLVLIEPSYQRAQQIQDCINARFSDGPPIASAVSPSFVRLRVPKAFHAETGHFLGLVRALYLQRDPRLDAVRAEKLAKELAAPGAPHALIALAFEGLGRDALPVLDRLYADKQDHVSFFAAVAGLRLGDHVAADAMTVHAQDPRCAYRLRAIRALGRVKGMSETRIALRGLLDDEDTRVRIAAYEALVKRNDSSIRSAPVGWGDFHLDRIPSRASPFIYVKRTGRPRIALFGEDDSIHPPVFYRAPDGCVTITADESERVLTVVRVATATGESSPPIRIEPSVAKLVRLLGGKPALDEKGRVAGLGLDYSTIVHALYRLSRDGNLTMGFVLEQPVVMEPTEVTPLEGRPESELRKP